LQIKTKIVSSHTADSKPVKQEVSGTVILPLLEFPALAYLGAASVAKYYVVETEAEGADEGDHAEEGDPVEVGEVGWVEVLVVGEHPEAGEGERHEDGAVADDIKLFPAVIDSLV
jgi:hypothetical protein